MGSLQENEPNENKLPNGEGHHNHEFHEADMEVEVQYIGEAKGEQKAEKMEVALGSPDTPKLKLSPSSIDQVDQPTPKRRKLDKAEKEAERLKREEEKRVREQERLEKLRIKEEEKKRKEEERVRREEEKKRKDEEKEQERLKREEEKKRKDEEKEQERLKREEEKKRKDDEREQERLKKEEEKRKREDERRKKEDERLKRELEKKQLEEKLEDKKRKQVEFMSKFLHITPPTRKSSGGANANESNGTPSNNEDATGETPSSSKPRTEAEVIDVEDNENEPPKSAGKNLLAKFNSSFQSDKKKTEPKFDPMPFQVKANMALAPAIRREFTIEQKTKFDQVFAVASVDDQQMEVDDEPSTVEKALYLPEVKTKRLGKQGRTLIKRSNANQEDEIEILFDKTVAELPTLDQPFYHFKLLQFHENRRPAYWGTFKTKSKRITGRRPFCQEEGLDYEFDSDDEWEDEPEDGEDLKSEKQSDDESTSAKNEEEDDDEEGWMVPHGYLSDDERADGKIDGDGEAAENENGDAKICDKDALKKQEELFYKEINLGKKLGLPYIQTDNLSAYRMILYTKKEVKPKKLPSNRTAAKKFNEKLKQVGVTALQGYVPSDDEDEESDGDWNVNKSEESSDSEVSDGGEEYATDSETDMNELRAEISGQAPQMMDTS